MSAARDTINSKLSRAEFTMMISMIMAVTALAIDMMLPAFGAMRSNFGLAADSNAVAPIITFFFLGLALGQPVFGPLSDALGRKRVLYAGLALYVVASIGAAFSPVGITGKFLISHFAYVEIETTTADGSASDDMLGYVYFCA